MAGTGGARPGAGRPKGSRNKLSEEFREKLEAACKRHKVDLIGGLVALCKNEDPKVELQARQTLLPYAYPKLRHVEVTADGGEYQPVFKLIVEEAKEGKK